MVEQTDRFISPVVMVSFITICTVLLSTDISTLEPDYSIGSHPRLAQVLSALPTSYPGQSILTEDLVTIHSGTSSFCSCGRPGLGFQVVGRLPKSEARGCSDTFSS